MRASFLTRALTFNKQLNTDFFHFNKDIFWGGGVAELVVCQALLLSTSHPLLFVHVMNELFSEE